MVWSPDLPRGGHFKGTAACLSALYAAGRHEDLLNLLDLSPYKFWHDRHWGVRALVAQDKHHNRRGLVQGGVIMTFADRSCGMTARYVSGRPTLATIQLDTHFVESGKIGEILLSKPRVVRATRSLIFISTEVTVDKRCIAMASGVFKILKNE